MNQTKRTCWTPERRARQSELIRQWQPWRKSTGPKSALGKAATSRNAWKDGELVKLRQMTKELNQILRAQRSWIDS